MCIATLTHSAIGHAQTDRSLFGPRETLPTSGTIVSRRAIPAIGASEWTLSNGVVVYIKSMSATTDTSIHLIAASSGGQSRIPISQYPTASYISQVVTRLGQFGAVSRQDYQQRLQSYSLNFGVQVNPDMDVLVGQIAAPDIDVLLQHVFLLMARASYDSTSDIISWRDSIKQQIVRRSANPQSHFSDTIVYTLSNGSPRVPIMTNDVADKIDPTRAFALWKDHFGNASGFIFVLAGAMDTTVLAPLVERYLGGLPSSVRQKQVQTLSDMHLPKGIVKRTVYAGTQPRADIRVVFSGATPPNAHPMDLRVLSEILQNRLLESLENNFGITVLPSSPFTGRYMVTVAISADTAEQASMLTGMRAVIDSLQRYGPTVDEVQDVVDQQIAKFSPVLEQSQYWANQILGAALWKMPFEFIGTDANWLSKMTPSIIQATAKHYLDLHNHAEFVLLPVADR